MSSFYLQSFSFILLPLDFVHTVDTPTFPPEPRIKGFFFTSVYAQTEKDLKQVDFKAPDVPEISHVQTCNLCFVSETERKKHVTLDTEVVNKSFDMRFVS